MIQIIAVYSTQLTHTVSIKSVTTKADVRLHKDMIQITAVYSTQLTHTVSMKSVTTKADVRLEMITSLPQVEWHYVQSIQLSIQALYVLSVGSNQHLCIYTINPLPCGKYF
jgi:hypothetical protein